MSEAYQPKHPPEVYLQFLNRMPIFEISFSIREQAYWLLSSNESFYFEGTCIEDVLDQAIEEIASNSSSNDQS